MLIETNVPTVVKQRAQALAEALDRLELVSPGDVEDFERHVSEDWIPLAGAQVVAQAWTDPDFQRRLMRDGRAAVAELGYAMPEHHRHLRVLENTSKVHNVIVCTLCSCTAFTLIGMPPGWYKDLDYRARLVREARSVLRGMGLDLPLSVDIRIWDTTADTRYLVLPMRPPGTENWSINRLKKIVTKESMIGVQRLEPPYASITA